MVATRLAPLGGTDLRRVQEAVNEALKGRITSVGTVTLATGAGTTTVASGAALFCNGSSFVSLFPVTANGGTEWKAGSLYIVPGTKQFVIHHVNSATTGRTFNYVVLG